MGYWLSTRGALLSATQMGRLQGIEPGMVTLKDKRGVRLASKFQWAGMIGNSMSINVLCHLLPRVLVSAGYVNEEQAARMIERCGYP